MTKRSKIYLFTAVVILSAGLAAAFKITSQPSFCARCHEIAPAVESWKQYSHSQVDCLDCHADPGPIGVIKRKVFAYKEVYVHFFTKEPRALEAKVNFYNCLLCHSGKKSKEYPQAANIAEGNSELVSIHQTVLADDVSCLNCHREVAHGNKD